MEPSTTATHNGKNVAILRKGPKQTRICSLNKYKSVFESDFCMSDNEDTQLVPTSELKNIKGAAKVKKKKAVKKAS